MENELAQYGGVLGSLVLVVLLLVKELISSKKLKDPMTIAEISAVIAKQLVTERAECKELTTRTMSVEYGDVMTKELCEERHRNIREDFIEVGKKLDKIEAQIEKLPARMNGGAKP